MIIKWVRRNIRRLALLVAIFSFTGIAIGLTVRQHCVCFLCEIVGQPPVPCHCTSLASYYLRRALGRSDFEYFPLSQSKNHGIQNEASESSPQAPCSARQAVHP